MFETEINSIKTIINGLRAHLGCKLAKKSKTKSKKSTDVMYSNIWVHCGHLVFLLSVMRAAENTDALKLHAATMDQEETEPKIVNSKKRIYC